MTETQYIAYFENLATQHMQLAHGDGGKAFFYVNNPYDTEEIDLALRNDMKSLCMVLDSPDGELDNNGSANYTDSIVGSFGVLMSTDHNPGSIRTARDECKQIGMQILGRMHLDSRDRAMIPGKQITFRITDVRYETLGPMAGSFYGWMFSFALVCPFAFSATSAIWRDK